MKKGDVVTIRDSSYSKSVIGGKLVHEYLAYGSNQNIQYTIIETHCVFPSTDFYQSVYKSKNRFNNTVIQAIDSGKVVFTEERFLKLVPPKHNIMIDVKSDGCLATGKYVEISDKLYKEIKRES